MKTKTKLKLSSVELKMGLVRKFIGRYSKEEIINIIVRGMSVRDINTYYRDALAYMKAGGNL